MEGEFVKFTANQILLMGGGMVSAVVAIWFAMWRGFDKYDDKLVLLDARNDEKQSQLEEKHEARTDQLIELTKTVHELKGAEEMAVFVTDVVTVKVVEAVQEAIKQE